MRATTKNGGQTAARTKTTMQKKYVRCEQKPQCRKKIGLSLFEIDQNHYSNLSLKFIKMCEEILKNRRKNSGNNSKSRLCKTTLSKTSGTKHKRLTSGGPKREPVRRGPTWKETTSKVSQQISSSVRNGSADFCSGVRLDRSHWLPKPSNGPDYCRGYF